MIIVNLTTTSSRLELCSATIWSMIHQELLPDRIDLWISKNGFMSDQGINELPSWIDEINRINKIINVNFVDNTGPYRKIIPALLRSNDEDILVYADDDVIYGAQWLKLLITPFMENNGEYIVSSRVRLKKKNIFGNYQSYNRYPLCYSESILKRDFIITGVGGCVLQKKHIKENLLKINAYADIAPRTDDLWISKLLELSNTFVLVCPNAFSCVQEIQHSNNALSQINNGGLSNRLTFTSLFIKIKNKFFGYFGLNKTNNDISMKKINNYFSFLDL